MEFSGDVRLISLGGSTTDRILGRTEVAESKVSIFLDNEEKKDNCLKKLEESDQRLAAGPGLYDWKFVLEESISDNTYKVHFGVAWYDLDFFDSNKNIFKNNQHQHIFSSIGVNQNDIQVSHWTRDIH